MTAETTKACPRCGQLKLRSHFGLCSSNKDGLQWWCKRCRADHAASKSAENVARATDWKLKNPERAKEIIRAIEAELEKDIDAEAKKNVMEGKKAAWIAFTSPMKDEQKEFYPEEISAFILSHLKEKVNDT